MLRLRPLLALAAVLAVLALGSAAHLVVAHGTRGRDLALADALATAGLDWALWGLAAPLVVVLARRVDPRTRPRARLIAVHAVGAAAVAMGQLAAFAGASTLLRAWRWGDSPDLGAALRSGFLVKFPSGVALYGAVVLGVWAWDARRRERARELESARLAAGLAEARSEALQASLAPHFLFNALNAAAALARRDPAGCEDVLVRLAALLRRCLDARRRPEVPLAEELTFLEDYLALQVRRYGERLRTRIRVPVELRAVSVPALVLQPLVENAVRHAVDPRVGGAVIEVEARRDDGRLELVVRDDGPGWPAQRTDGVGLRQVRERLALRRGPAGWLELAVAEGGGAEARLLLPLAEAAP